MCSTLAVGVLLDSPQRAVCNKREAKHTPVIKKAVTILFFFLSPKILDVLCSLCVCNGVAVRANQNLICDNLLPKRDLLLQTRLVNDVQRYQKEKSFTVLSFTDLWINLKV